jgi:hypothetical protein
MRKLRRCLAALLRSVGNIVGAACGAGSRVWTEGMMISTIKQVQSSEKSLLVPKKQHPFNQIRLVILLLLSIYLFG